jgi:hypothetical protein
MRWRSDKPAELYWMEAQVGVGMGVLATCAGPVGCKLRPCTYFPLAWHTTCHMWGTLLQDGGDPAVEVSPRDIVYTLSADEAAAEASAAEGNGSSHAGGVQPRVLATTDLRCGGVSWGNDDMAILYEVSKVYACVCCNYYISTKPIQPTLSMSSCLCGANTWTCLTRIVPSLLLQQSWWKTRRSVSWLIAPGDPSKKPQVLFDRWVGGWVGGHAGAPVVPPPFVCTPVGEDQ